MRFIWFILNLCCLWVIASPAIVQAQNDDLSDGGWRAWLRSEDGRVVMVDSEGRVEDEATLPRIRPMTKVDFLPFPVADQFPPTGETLLIVPDAHFPAMPISPNNSLHVYDPTSQSRYPFYTADHIALMDAWFVQNGQRILLRGMQAGGQGVWLLLERDGRVTRPFLPYDRRDIHGTTRGFLYLALENEQTRLMGCDVEAIFSDRQYWADEGRWTIVHIKNIAETYGPFMLWAQLAEPITELPPPTTIALTPYPTPAPLMAPGDEAVVQTVGGEVLYLRDAPVTGEIIMHLFDGMRVNLLDGPYHEDMLIWWKLRTADGTEGWAVQAFEDVTTLLPYVEPTEKTD
jgi:hypothetical protein